jgi:hypothetical protein
MPDYIITRTAHSEALIVRGTGYACKVAAVDAQRDEAGAPVGGVGVVRRAPIARHE